MRAVVGAAVLSLAMLAAFTVGDGLADIRKTVAAMALAGVLLALALIPRPELTLSVVLLYLGLLDGYVKLGLQAPGGRAMRDLLLYAVVMGAFVRVATARRPLRLPPLTVLVAGFVVVVLVQVLNPATPDPTTFAAGVRQHLEFVPLFFFGYAVLRTRARLEGFFVLLVVIVAANSLAGLAQFNLTPEEFAQWGPGYAEKALGDDPGAGQARTYYQSGDIERVRPLALGSDSGFGGGLAVLCLPAALALLIAGHRPRLQVIGAVGVAASALALVTSQARSAVIGAVLAVLIFALIALSARQAARTLGGLAVAGLAVYVVISLVASATTSGSFERYRTIAPSVLVSTASQERAGNIGVIPLYLREVPFGDGLGRRGPASALSSTQSTRNVETQFAFFIVELGVAGLLIFLALALSVIQRGIVTVRRMKTAAERSLVAALVAPSAALVVLWFVSVVTTSPPFAPWFWFSAGAIAWWSSQRTTPAPPASLVRT